jgi:sporulation protein YlmC with PRC-barrel domain
MEHRENEHHIKKLQLLSDSGYEIKDGQPDIIQWPVFNSTGEVMGKISNLLFDQEEQSVKYMVLNLWENSWQPEEREVLIPMNVAELIEDKGHVILPNITAQQINVLPDYHKGEDIASADSELYGHSNQEESVTDASKSSGSYSDHIPYQIISRIYQEENEAESAFRLLMENGFEESNLKVTPYNPLNSITDLQGNTNTEFIGDGSRDEYILSIAAASAEEVILANQLISADSNS